MPYCPDCGRHIALGDVQCPECGTRIGGKAPEGPTGPPAPSPERQEPQRPRPDSEERRRAITYAGGVLGLMVVGAVGMEALDERGPVDVVEEWRISGVRTESVATVSDCNRRLTITGRGRLDCE